MKPLFKKTLCLIGFLAFANIILICCLLLSGGYQSFIIPYCLILTIFWIFANILPYRIDSNASARLTIMMGGRTLCYYALYGLCWQIIIFIFIYPAFIHQLGYPNMFWLNSIFSIISFFLILWNGILRIFFTSQRLRLTTRLMMLFCIWIPVVNLLVLLNALRKVHAEYDFGCYQEAIRLTRAESNLCQTRYPLLFVHGIGFRDLRYFNYWGRIPRELTRYGAEIYYGNQEALGTIVYNAEDIKKKIQQIVAETNCQKVNIIAHSKGGLDARYAISKLAMAPFVASLTTINTPHRGCRFVDYACKLPDRLYRLVANCFNRTFRRLGDRNPDFYAATRQFSTAASTQFNDQVPDTLNVYYQSYTSVMKHCLSDLLLTIPYCMIYPLEGKNDGLVSITSAQWGDFKGVITNRRRRGISHGDMIDLKREDYQGFDIVEHYVQIVSELKKMGF